MTIQGENPIEVTARNKEELRVAMKEAEQWMLPATNYSIIAALGELYMVSVKRAEQSEDRKATFLLYTRELRKFPGDIVLKGIHSSTGKFFPALNELIQVITADRLLRVRRQLIDAVRTCLENWDKPKRVCNPVTKQQIRRMEALVHGNRAVEHATNNHDGE